MCGFVGFITSDKRDSSFVSDTLKNMNNCLVKRGPDEEGYYIKDNLAFAHKRLIVIDPEGRKTTNDNFSSK